MQFIVLHKTRNVVHACNPSIQKVEAGGSGVQDHPWLTDASLNHRRPCLKKIKERKSMDARAVPGSARNHQFNIASGLHCIAQPGYIFVFL